MTTLSPEGKEVGHSPYLDLPKRSEEEVRRMKAMGEMFDHILRPTPAQEWLGSERVTKALERFRKEDGEQK